MASPIAIVVGLTLLCLVLRAVYRARHLPPGPVGLPIIGNALQIPQRRQSVVFAELAKKHGDVMHLSVLGRSIVLLTSRQAISDLLEKKGPIYSDRPIIPMASELIGYSRFLIWSPYGPVVKDSRKLIGSVINTRNAPELQSIIQTKILDFIPRLLASPRNFELHMRWLVASISLQITHGHSINDLDDPLVRLANLLNSQFATAVAPGNFAVDSLPFLRYVPDWIPGAGFKSFAKFARQTADRSLDEPYQQVYADMERGTATPSFVSRLIEKEQHPSPEDLFLHKMTSSQIYVAGADTTISALQSALLILALFPDVQRRARAEIEALLGPSQLPSCGDRSSLPYVAGLVKEVHRWNPVAPLGLPHRAAQDDVYKGYHIPKGATILANSWAILHDPSIYPDPFEVKPERYLGETTEDLNPDPEAWSFGYGRRVCPGRILANDILFLFTTALLVNFDIANPRTPDGDAVRADVEYVEGIVSHPPSFTCDITPRASGAKQLVDAES